MPIYIFYAILNIYPESEPGLTRRYFIMNKTVVELMKKIPKDKLKELTAAASKAANKDDILALAKNSGIDISSEEAEAVFAAFSEEASVKGEDLDAVSGGGSCDGEC